MAQRSRNGLGPGPTTGPIETVGVTVLPGVPMPPWAEAVGGPAVPEPAEMGPGSGLPDGAGGLIPAMPMASPPAVPTGPGGGPAFDPAAVAQMDPAALMAAFAALQAQAPIAQAPIAQAPAGQPGAIPATATAAAAPGAGAPQPAQPLAAWPTPAGVGPHAAAAGAAGAPPLGAPVGYPSPMAPGFPSPAGHPAAPAGYPAAPTGYPAAAPAGYPAAAAAGYPGAAPAGYPTAAPAPAWTPPPSSPAAPGARASTPVDEPVSAFALGAGGYPAGPVAYPGNPMAAPLAGTGAAAATAQPESADASPAAGSPVADPALVATVAEVPAADPGAADDAPAAGLTPEQLALVQRYAALVAMGQIPGAPQPGGQWGQQDPWQPPMAVGQGSPPAPARHAKRRGLVALAVVGLVAIGLAGVAALMLPGLLGSEQDATSSGAGLRAPSAVGALVAMEDPGMGEAVQALIGMGIRPSGMTVTAAYGAQRTGSLAMAVMATRLRSSADARAQIDAWAQRVGTEVAEPVSGTGDAAGITCAAATETETAPAGSFCVWGDTGVRGNTFVVGSDPEAALQHTIAVRLAMAGSSQPAA